MRNLPALDLLSRSLEEAGQLVPVLVIPGERAGLWILIDGYLRVEALKRLDREVVRAEVFQGSEEEALMVHLARGQARNWETVEEAALIRELHDRFGCSLRLLAARIGRSASWVSHRISLINELPEEVLERVLQGRLSVWAATRILLPFARANSDHARSLLQYMDANSLSTRQLQGLWHHYQQSGDAVRQKLMETPDLFFKSLRVLEMEQQNPPLEESPEETWVRQIQRVQIFCNDVIVQKSQWDVNNHCGLGGGFRGRNGLRKILSQDGGPSHETSVSLWCHQWRVSSGGSNVPADREVASV